MIQAKRLLLTLALLVAVTGFGAAGYHFLEGASWGDAVYMTIITLSTVGYSEVFALDGPGRVFTVVLIVLGIVLVFGLAGMWVRVIFEGELEEALGRRRRVRVLRDLKGHYVICGYGRFGSRVAAELAARGQRFVVVDPGAQVPEGVVAIRDDATKDAVLREARVEFATGLLAALPSDADNVYVTLAAKELNPGIFIVARCESEGGERKLRTAGAARVVAPYALSAHRMVELAINPALVDVEDLATAAGNAHVSVAEIVVATGSPLIGHLLEAGRLLGHHSVVPVGILDANGRLDASAVGSRTLEEGDVIVVFGTPAAVEAFAAASSGTH
jgi:voltage-gated potassium channel